MVLLQRTRLGRGYWTAMIRIRAAQIQSAEHAGAACGATLAAKAVRSHPPHVSGESQICDEGFQECMLQPALSIECITIVQLQLCYQPLIR